MAPFAHLPSSRLWVLSTPRSGYALRLDETDAPCHVHWGEPLTPEQADALAARRVPEDSSFEGRPPVGEELPVDGGARYGTPSLQVRHADGTRAFEWHHLGHRVEDSTLALDFRDRHYPLAVTLHYRVHEDSDVIERWLTLRHTGDDAPVTVLRADSAAWTLPPLEDYRASHVTGQWSAESQLHRERLPHGETVFTSRRGVTSHHANPWLMLDAGDAGEEHGRVWSTALAWSGSWRITAQRAPDGRAGVTGGAGHDGTTVVLAPGAEHTTPRMCGLWTDGGFGAAGRAWHRYVLDHVLPHPREVRPVLYNSWEATGFDVDEAGQRSLAARAAELGVELFVMDDGWFGGRRGDHAGLGDWTATPDRFPGGLGPLVEEVHRLGMRFGLWVEPEMVNPDSDLYRAHPDWVLHYPHRTRTRLRNQLVLNLARRDVADWTHAWLTRLVGDHGIDFLKWDMNRAFSEAGWPGGPPHDPDRVWTAYVTNLYALMDRLRADHPGLRIEACAGGGGRVDLGILARTDQAWASDNTDAADRLTIQHGYGQLYPARTMAAWVTDVPNQLTGRTVPLRFRFHVAMAGVLAVGGDITAWSEEEFAEGAALVAQYKTIRHLVQHGTLHRLRAPGDDGLSAVQYTSPGADEAVVLLWQRTTRFGRPRPAPRLAALDPAARYRDQDGTVHHGAVLRARGLPVTLPPGDWASAMVHLVRT
jgi:alpha-galactosidase